RPPGSPPFPYTTLFRSERPGRRERSTVLPSVAGSGTDGRRAPFRWRVAPSSTGTGMVDQSGVCTLPLIGSLRDSVLGAVEELGRSEEHTSELQSPDHLV